MHEIQCHKHMNVTMQSLTIAHTNTDIHGSHAHLSNCWLVLALDLDPSGFHPRPHKGRHQTSPFPEEYCSSAPHALYLDNRSDGVSAKQLDYGGTGKQMIE